MASFHDFNPDTIADINELSYKLHKFIFTLLKETDDAKVMIAAIATNYCLFCAACGISEEDMKAITKETWDRELEYLIKKGIRK